MDDRERIQRLIARAIATSPAGHGLCLIGGFRYRLIDRSARISQDLDYHFAEDLVAKQAELLALVVSRVLPEVHRRLAYEGDARTGMPADETDWLRSVHLAFWKTGVAMSRIEIPVKITRVQCSDRPTVKTADGTVYLTVSDADMIESKIVALAQRTVLEHRDLVDLFLFSDKLVPESRERLAAKLISSGVTRDRIGQPIASLHDAAAYHARAIDTVLHDQLDAPTADALRAAGGGEMILSEVLAILDRLGVGRA